MKTLLDATGLPGGGSRSQLQGAAAHSRCHGLAPWSFTFGATQDAQSLKTTLELDVVVASLNLHGASPQGKPPGQAPGHPVELTPRKFCPFFDLVLA